jgi:hypothetical protein
VFIRKIARAARTYAKPVIISSLLALVVGGCGQKNEPVGAQSPGVANDTSPKADEPLSVSVLSVAKDSSPRDYVVSVTLNTNLEMTSAKKVTIELDKGLCFAILELELANNGTGDMNVAYKDLTFSDTVVISLGDTKMNLAAVSAEGGVLLPLDGVNKYLKAGERKTAKIVVIVKEGQRSVTVRYKQGAPMAVAL